MVTSNTLSFTRSALGRTSPSPQIRFVLFVRHMIININASMDIASDRVHQDIAAERVRWQSLSFVGNRNLIGARFLSVTTINCYAARTYLRASLGFGLELLARMIFLYCKWIYLRVNFYHLWRVL